MYDKMDKSQDPLVVLAHTVTDGTPTEVCKRLCDFVRQDTPTVRDLTGDTCPPCTPSLIPREDPVEYPPLSATHKTDRT